MEQSFPATCMSCFHTSSSHDTPNNSMNKAYADQSQTSTVPGKLKHCHIKKYISTSYVGMGHVQNGCLYIRYRRSSTKTKAEGCKTLTILLWTYSQNTVCLSQGWENQTWKSWFRSSFFFSLCIHWIYKVYVYEYSTYQPTALLLNMCLFVLELCVSYYWPVTVLHMHHGHFPIHHFVLFRV